MKLHIRAKLGLSPSMTARLPMLFHEYAEDLQNVQVNMVGSKLVHTNIMDLNNIIHQCMKLRQRILHFQIF